MLRLLVVASVLAGAGCAARPSDPPDLPLARDAAVMTMDAQSVMVLQKLMMEMMNNPDVPAWHAQREQMSLAQGDRQFDRPFDRIFDSMTIALASIGCRVENMERASGYITASLPEMAPDELAALKAESRQQYAIAKGYSADTLAAATMFSTMLGDIDTTAGLAGLTLSMVKQSDDITKVKLRFGNVYYPPLVSRYYDLVWRAVDKQVFLDEGLD